MEQRITEQEYQNAIIDLSAAKHVNLDHLIAETSPVSKWSLAFGSLFSSNRLSSEVRGIEGLLNLLVNKEGLPTRDLVMDEYGRWQFTGDQLARLRTLYRSQRLQSILDTIRKDEQIIDDYAKQATIHPIKTRKYEPLKHPPVLRTEDLMANLKDSMRNQDKKLERIAAKAALKETKEKNREMLRRVSERSERASLHDAEERSQPNW